MELMQALCARESCRAYADKPLERQLIERLLETACLAPSAGNGQPWRFVAVTKPDILNPLAEMTRTANINHWVVEAPCIIAIWEKLDERMLSRYGEQYAQRNWPSMDIGLCTLQLCLAAQDMGLGTCILGYFPEDEAKEFLGIPQEGRLRLLITLGYPKEQTEPRAKRRLPLDQVASFIE